MEAKTYKNLTSISQLGIPPGETGERKISDEKESRMVARGAIEVVGTPVETASPEKSEEAKAAEAKAAEEQKAAEDKKAADEAAQQAQAAGGRAGKVR